MSITAVTSRVDQIEAQLASLQTAFVPAAASSSATSSSGGAGLTSAASSSPTPAASFQSALAGALGGASPGTTSGSTSSGGLPTAGLTAPVTASASGSASLPGAASTMLTSDQQQFASRLAADTGLDPGVVSAWLLAEESGGAAVSRQAAGNNDWLNIGYTDSGTFGSADSVWSDPVAAADATAGWLKGQDTIPGYGTASSGIQAILQTAGQPPATQISALQSSGWASSGYPSLTALYTQVAG